MGQHRDISAAVAVAICMRQHSSFPLLMAHEEPKVRILWAVTLNGVRHSGFSSRLVFNIYVRISASSLSLSFSFSPYPDCIACLDQVLRTWKWHWTMQKKRIIPYSVFSLTLPDNLGVSPGWESSGYTFDTNHWKFLQPSLFCSWRRSLQSGFSAFMGKGRKHKGNKVTGVFVLEMVGVEMTTQELFLPPFLSWIL